DEFMRFLAAVAQNKTLQVHRRLVETQNRSLARQVPLDGAACEQAVQHGPGADPSESVASEDEWQQLLRGLPERDRAAVEGLRAGQTFEELARRLDVSVRSLRRILERRRRPRPP